MAGDVILLQPWWLILLGPVWFWWLLRRRFPGPWPRLMPVIAIRYPLLSVLTKKESSSPDLDKINLPDLLLTLAMSLMVLALTQPAIHTTEIEAEKHIKAPDLVLVVDTAVSMTLKDYVVDTQPVDRMSITRQLLDAFIADYPGNRMGLVILGNPPALWLPLTADKQVVRDAVRRIRTSLGGRLSDTGATLELVRKNYSGSDNKVVILVSDGGLQLGDISPQSAATELAAAGFTLYVIAVGSQHVGSGFSDKGSLIYQPIDLTMMMQVAANGDGQLFEAKDTETFRDILKIIDDKHSQSIPPPATRWFIQHLYPALISTAMLLLLLASLTPKKLFFRNKRV